MFSVSGEIDLNTIKQLLEKSLLYTPLSTGERYVGALKS